MSNESGFSEGGQLGSSFKLIYENEINIYVLRGLGEHIIMKLRNISPTHKDGDRLLEFYHSNNIDGKIVTRSKLSIQRLLQF